MLKQHSSLPNWRRRVALFLSLALSIFGAGLVHALNAKAAVERPPPAVQDGYHLIETDVDFKLNGMLQRAVRVTTMPSNWAWINGGASPQWMIRLQVFAAGDETLRVETVVFKADPAGPELESEGIRGKFRVVARPVLLVKQGEAARIEITDDTDQQKIGIDLKSRWMLAESLDIPVAVLDRQRP